MSSANADYADARAVFTPPWRSLAGQLVLWFVGASFLLIMAVSTTLYFGVEAQTNWLDDQLLEKRFDTMRSIVSSNAEGQSWIGHEVSEDMEGPRRVFVRLVSADGRAHDETPNMSSLIGIDDFPSAHGLAPNIMRRGSALAADGRHYRVLSARAAAAGPLAPFVTVQIAMDTTLDEVVRRRYRYSLLWIIVASLGLCAVIGHFVVSRAIGPLTRITAATSSVTTMTLDQRLDLTGLPRELHELGAQFNTMLDRLQTAYAGLRHYADDVAHELRTPLNKMLLGAEVALLGANSTEAYRDALEQNMDQCEKLAQLVQRLLFIARADNKQTALVVEPINLHDKLESVRAYFEESAVDLGIDLRVAAPHDVTFEADRGLVQRAIANLVANALSHSSRGGEVVLSGEAVEGDVRIVVTDKGCGIGPEHVAHVFNRFYRADPDRTAGGDRDGMGLGLAITKGIVALHGGTISLQSAPGKGTCVVIVLPRESSTVSARS
ncbi:two-component sensor histidine kinase [alpha proteobacterium U9-1i]|nr:two-component sensor histidine kinase [alpha proteobacterium U9-1i]